MPLALRDTPRLTAILRKCYSHVEVADRDRNRGIGVTNLKRVFGRPDDPATNHERLAGERLRPGSTVHVIDDLVHTGATLASAAKTLREAELSVTRASCLLVAPARAGWPDALATAGIDEITALATTTQL